MNLVRTPYDKIITLPIKLTSGEESTLVLSVYHTKDGQSFMNISIPSNKYSIIGVATDIFNNSESIDHEDTSLVESFNLSLLDTYTMKGYMVVDVEDTAFTVQRVEINKVVDHFKMVDKVKKACDRTYSKKPTLKYYVNKLFTFPLTVCKLVCTK